MFNVDDLRSALTRMYDYSPVDGFVDISNGLGDMMTSLANEPSVGLFYVQQHTHKAVPNVVNLRNNIVAKSREIGLHAEDSEDSIAMVRSMVDCGFPIVDDMIKDIAKCLVIMSSKQPRRGLISSRSGSGFKTRQAGWRGDANDVEKSASLLSSVFESTKPKENVLNWASAEQTANGSDTMLSVGEELPLSSRVLSGDDEEDTMVDNWMSNVSGFGDFDGFKDDKEAGFEGNDRQHKREQ